MNDKYQKKGLAAATHRVAMCDLAVQDSDWLMVDPWEARAPTYTPTAQVLDHFHEEINVKNGGVEVLIEDEWTGARRVERRQARIMLLAGSDLILTMSEPGVWAEKDVRPCLSGRVPVLGAPLTRPDTPTAAAPHPRPVRLLVRHRLVLTHCTAPFQHEADPALAAV